MAYSTSVPFRRAIPEKLHSRCNYASVRMNNEHLNSMAQVSQPFFFCKRYVSHKETGSKETKSSRLY